MKESLARIYQSIRNFLFSSVNKEFLVFLFFLALSSIFWLMMTLNETYEKDIPVPIRLTGVPRNAVMTGALPDTIRVTVRDKGYTLAAYLYGDRIHPLSMSFSAYANKKTGRGHIPTADIQKLLRGQLFGSSKIIGVKPDKLDFTYNYGLSKRVPIRVAGTVTPNSSYYLARTLFNPEMVTIYANQSLLDSITYVKTIPLRIVNFSDTVQRQVNLSPIAGVKMVPASVSVAFYPDILTEEDIEVPITAEGMPEGKVLRTFPSRATVRFTVGASSFRHVKPEQFSVVVDYKELADHPSEKCNIHLRTWPHNVRNARVTTPQVDYLIEQP